MGLMALLWQPPTLVWQWWMRGHWKVLWCTVMVLEKCYVSAVHCVGSVKLICHVVLIGCQVRFACLSQYSQLVEIRPIYWSKQSFITQRNIHPPGNPPVFQNLAPSLYLALTWKNRNNTRFQLALQTIFTESWLTGSCWTSSAWLFTRLHVVGIKMWHLLLETLVVTAVTEAREMVSGSRDPARRMAFLSRSSISRTAGSSGPVSASKSTITHCSWTLFLVAPVKRTITWFIM